MNFVRHFKNVLENFKDSNAVGYWDKENIFKSLTYQDVSDISLKIVANLRNVLEDNSSICVGLYMQKNHFIPSLLISLQMCNSSFIFLDPEASNDKNIFITKKLSIMYIISYELEDKYTNILSVCWTKIKKFDNIPLLLWKSNLSVQSNQLDSISYCITTSGTTGDPKIVKVTHECIGSNIEGLRNVFKVTENDVIYFGTPLTFDPSMVELFLALITGCVLIIPPNTKKSGRLLNALFPKDKCHSGITILQIVPSLLLCWSDADIKFLLEESTCRILAFGGEKFPEAILKLPRSKNLRMFNLYGITEVSCWSSTYEVVNDDFVTLGDSLPDTILEVRSENGTIITDGKGEMYIGSYCRICYVDDEDPNTITKPLFRATGDYVRILNKSIQYLGRVNNIIKRLGQKINLSEVEDIVFQHTAIINVCIWCEREYKLILFAAIKEFDESIKQKIIDKLRIKLLQVLPRAYFPDHIEIVPSIPLSDHGKVDIRTLEGIYKQLVCDLKEQSPIDTFKLLCCKYLGLSINSIEKFTDYTFFGLGGTSITVIQCLSELKSIVDESCQSELTNLVLEKTLNECYAFISSLQPVPYRKFKKRKYDTYQLLSKSVDCIDMRIAWKFDLEACVDSNPTILNERTVSIGSFSHKFVTLDALTGTKVSETILPDAIESGCCAIPSTTYVCVGCYDGHLYCIDIETGIIIWKYKSADQIKCTSVVFEGNHSITFGSYDKMLHCVNFNSGSLIWKIPIFGSVQSDPIIYDEKIYVATTLGVCYCISVWNGEQVWKHDKNVPIFGSPVLIEKLSLVGWVTVDGTLHLFSCTNGEQRSTFQVDGNVFSGLNHLDNIVVFGCSNHKVYGVKADLSLCHLHFATLLDSPITSTPYLFSHLGNTLCCVTTNKGGVYLISFSCGSILGQLQLEVEIFSSPRICNSMLYLGCRDNNLYCIHFKNKDKNR